MEEKRMKELFWMIVRKSTSIILNKRVIFEENLKKYKIKQNNMFPTVEKFVSVDRSIKKKLIKEKKNGNEDFCLDIYQIEGNEEKEETSRNDNLFDSSMELISNDTIDDYDKRIKNEENQIHKNTKKRIIERWKFKKKRIEMQDSKGKQEEGESDVYLKIEILLKSLYCYLLLLPAYKIFRGNKRNRTTSEKMYYKFYDNTEKGSIDSEIEGTDDYLFNYSYGFKNFEIFGYTFSISVKYNKDSKKKNLRNKKRKKTEIVEYGSVGSRELARTQPKKIEDKKRKGNRIRRLSFGFTPPFSQFGTSVENESSSIPSFYGKSYEQPTVLPFELFEKKASPNPIEGFKNYESPRELDSGLFPSSEGRSEFLDSEYEENSFPFVEDDQEMDINKKESELFEASKNSFYESNIESNLSEYDASFGKERFSSMHEEETPFAFDTEETQNKSEHLDNSLESNISLLLQQIESLSNPSSTPMSFFCYKEGEKKNKFKTEKIKNTLHQLDKFQKLKKQLFD